MLDQQLMSCWCDATHAPAHVSSLSVFRWALYTWPLPNERGAYT